MRSVDIHYVARCVDRCSDEYGLNPCQYFGCDRVVGECPGYMWEPGLGEYGGVPHRLCILDMLREIAAAIDEVYNGGQR